MQVHLTRRAMSISLSLGICLAFLASAVPVRADIAPPRLPPGSNIAPGSETSHIQMTAEKVVIDFVSPKVTGDDAWVTASFTMHNPEKQAETMQVRFPLNGDPQTDQSGKSTIPVIDDFVVTVNGNQVTPQVITLTQDLAEPAWPGLLTWAVFNVSFPGEHDTAIQVDYTLHPTSLGSQAGVNYILGTGAGWAGPIGTADLLIRLPYEVSCENYICGQSNPAPAFAANVAVWHWDAYEPGPSDVLNAAIVKPNIWKRVLEYQKLVANDAYNLIDWRELAHGLNQAALDYKGFIRSDAGAGSLVAACIQAYEKWAALQPQETTSHSELAAFLWSVVANQQPQDAAMLDQIRQEVNRALELDAQNAQALQLRAYLDQFAPTETEVVPTETLIPTPTLAATLPPVSTATPIPTDTTQPSITPTPTETLVPNRTPRPTLTAAALAPADIAKLPSSSNRMGIDIPFVIFAVGIAFGLVVLIVGVWWMERRS